MKTSGHCQLNDVPFVRLRFLHALIQQNSTVAGLRWAGIRTQPCRMNTANPNRDTFKAGCDDAATGSCLMQHRRHSMARCAYQNMHALIEGRRRAHPSPMQTGRTLLCTAVTTRSYSALPTRNSVAPKTFNTLGEVAADSGRNYTDALQPYRLWPIARTRPCKE